MSGTQSALGIVLIVGAILVVLFLVGLFYLGDRPRGPRDDSDRRPRTRY